MDVITDNHNYHMQSMSIIIIIMKFVYITGKIIKLFIIIIPIINYYIIIINIIII